MSTYLLHPTNRCLYIIFLPHLIPLPFFKLHIFETCRAGGGASRKDDVVDDKGRLRVSADLQA